ncbi:MAG TPA: hypothetical protein VGB44_01655 [Flavobacterium sp.]|jgi:ATP-dependent protease HslVU (ClpYQ) ATPase subunit
MNANFEAIDKENILKLRFPQHDVLDDKEDQSRRQSELRRGLALGNLEHEKIRIYFEDSNSKKVVETTVWGVTDNQVILKKGVRIPINRIYKSL